MRHILHRRVFIFLYHRIFEAEIDPFLLCVSPAHFSEHLEILKKNYQVLSLFQLVQYLQEEKFPQKDAVVLTFDDGYQDNFVYAKPILEKYEIPATIFITAGYIGLQKELWWNELERLILLSNLPTQITLTIKGKEYSWTFEKDINVPTKIIKNWHLEIKNDCSGRYKFFRTVYNLLKIVDPIERDNVMFQLKENVHNYPFERPDYFVLTKDEINKLSTHKLIEIGSHTLTHPVLSSLSYDAQKQELLKSKQILEEITNKQIKYFAYPYGGNSDINNISIQLVKECGYLCACANVPGFIRKDSNIFSLPRFLVRNWNGDVFEKWLHTL